MPHDNPVNHLQELCQREGAKLPVYKASTCREGFHVKVEALGLVSVGVGKNKKDAKKDAAIALLEMLG